MQIEMITLSWSTWSFYIWHLPPTPTPPAVSAARVGVGWADYVNTIIEPIGSGNRMGYIK